MAFKSDERPLPLATDTKGKRGHATPTRPDQMRQQSRPRNGADRRLTPGIRAEQGAWLSALLSRQMDATIGTASALLSPAGHRVRASTFIRRPLAVRVCS